MEDKLFCKDCKYFYDDNRETVYRRNHCYFCKKKGVHFSRNVKVGEKNRISPNDFACDFFVKSDK